MSDNKDRYLYLNLDPTVVWGSDNTPSGVTIHVKLDDEGVVVDAWADDECVASTWKTYEEFGVVVKQATGQEDLPDGMVKVNGEVRKDCAAFHHDD
tara:strand:- start:672 stop:959 length:288 start_codon:yes stop_codon:yes gene_type:complete